jgi:hypothetical protein
MYKHTEKAKKIIKEKVLKSWETHERLLKHKQGLENYVQKYGRYPSQCDSAREAISKMNIERLLNDTNFLHKRFKRGYYTSLKTGITEYYHSSYEERRMVELDNDTSVKYWTKRHDIILKYGVGRRYYPDFFIEKNDNQIIIEEVKGYVKNEDDFIKKIKALKVFCLENSYACEVNFMNNKRTEYYKKLINEN